MATLRSHVLISRPPSEVWAAVSDAGTINEWFPLIEKSSVAGSRRSLVLEGGTAVEEDIVTSDAELRRFQYRIVGGDIPVDTHLGTIDVIDVDGGSLVVYSTEVTPDALDGLIGPAVADAVNGLKEKLS